MHRSSRFFFSFRNKCTRAQLSRRWGERVRRCADRDPACECKTVRSAGTETSMRVRVVYRILCCGAAAAFASQAQATWKPEYTNNAPEVQAWYRNAELTEAAKNRFPFKKCCDHADVVKTKFNVNRT